MQSDKTTEITILDSKDIKVLASPKYNYCFNKKNGQFMRWGVTKEDDPEYGLPEIADIEVTTICRGVGGKKLCPFCYKGNTPNGINMSFETFKKIFDILPKSITQIAFGADASATSNPDLFKMMEYCRERGVVPNITVADISDETADKLASLCGAVSVSYYDKDSCYGSVQKLVSRGKNQINIHNMICEESFDSTLDLLNDRQTDPRLQGMNAIVFLSLKRKGRGVVFTPLAADKFQRIVDLSLEKGISFGFDSCGCSKFLKAVEKHPRYNEFKMVAEPCESLCFSMYCDAKGIFYPCSFTEGIEDWKEGIDLTGVTDFVEEVWLAPKVKEYRQKIINARNSCKACFYYDV